MKLKEKLSKEYAIDSFPEGECDFPIDWRDAQGIWLAGFEKAREMTVDLILKEYSYECDDSGSVVTEGRDIHTAVKKLGEEEVNEASKT